MQGGIGYTQYELGIPPWIVILAHIVGATTVVGLSVWFHLGLFDTDGQATSDAVSSDAMRSTDPAPPLSMETA